jgi:hypothetical protein
MRQLTEPHALAVLGVLAAVVIGPSARAQELEPLLWVLQRSDHATDVETRTLDFYRIPIGYTIRSVEEHRWGLRLTMPVSVGAHNLSASTGVGDLHEKVETVSLVPGLELHLRGGERWLLKPFGELGATGFTQGGDTELLYACGLAARGARRVGPVDLTLGIMARLVSARQDRAGIGDYSLVGFGADAQVPLGFAVGARRVRGGLYGIGWFFPDLELPPAVENDVGRLWELGVSVSTEPAVTLWKIKLPWLGLGYRFGDVFEGIRINFSFPF